MHRNSLSCAFHERPEDASEGQDNRRGDNNNSKITEDRYTRIWERIRERRTHKGGGGYRR
jgi:hypothetical protein